MSHHAGVSCDSCLRSNFQGKRYKCLVCLDYDLCSICHDSGSVSGNHSFNHPMQCILTRNDIDLFYAGEIVANEQPYSFTCPLCGRLGFTDATLYDHVNSSHRDNWYNQVVCPICATLPDGEPNQVTDDFLNHLNLEHRTNNSTINPIRELNDQAHIARGLRIRHLRSNNNNRNRRSLLVNSTPTTTNSSSSIGTTSGTNNRSDATDPIAQLLSQLSDVRRANNAGGGNGSNGQHLWQISGERNNSNNRSLSGIIGQRQRRIPLNLNESTSGLSAAAAAMGSIRDSVARLESSNQSMPYVLMDSTAPSPSSYNIFNNNHANGGGGANHTKTNNQSFLLNNCALMSSSLPETELKRLECLKADRSMFVQELIFACLSHTDSIRIDQLIQNLSQKQNAEQESSLKNLQPENSPTRELQEENKTKSTLTTSTTLTLESKENLNNKNDSSTIPVISSNDQLSISSPSTESNNNLKQKVSNKIEAPVAATNMKNILNENTTTTTNVSSIYSYPNSDSQDRRMKSSMSSLVNSATTSTLFAVAPPQQPTSNNHRTNKVVSKVKSSPSIATSSVVVPPVVHHRSMAPTAADANPPGSGVGIGAVGNGGRRSKTSILKQQQTNDPPPSNNHFDH